MVQGVKAQHVQVDEIWSFVGCKQKTKQAGGCGDGDCWTFVAIDADSKLVIAYLVGLRDGGHATELMHDVASRVVDRVQLTTDGYSPYREVAAGAFGEKVDFAQLQKIYAPAEGKGQERRYSGPVCIGSRRQTIIGRPDRAHVSTSYIERQNLTVRMRNRRFMRLTNAFSKKWTNHQHALALHYFVYAPTHWVGALTSDMDNLEKSLILELDPICNKKAG